ncbi:recombinase family protein [Brevundimonas sp. 2R-24]|uniref:Recombinase family protein n=1 Tax=Peiella sedimenti TaxID=3061083 RepID=A0ABT8SJB2_9CAUL|nr:recombinase family protein [Caulobacteraceae bacterium XZ-24]
MAETASQSEDPVRAAVAPSTAIGLVCAADEDSVASQRARLAAAGFDGMAVEAPAGAAARPQVDRVLLELRAGQTLYLPGLDTLRRNVPDTLRTLRGLLELGVEIRVAEPDSPPVTLAPEPVLIEALTLLSTFSANHRNAPNTPGRSGRSETLSEVQAKHARRLFDEGQSLRTISLIFRVPPDVVWRAIGRRSALRDEG